MADKNLILYLPMDDPGTSVVAYDYSNSRADAQLSGGAHFSKDAKIGKSLALGVGEAQTPIAINFDGDFTLSLYVKTTSNKIGWLMNLPGVDKYMEKWVDVDPNTWVFLAFIKDGSTFSVYKHLTRMGMYELTATPIGFSLSDTNLDMSDCVLIDELMLFDMAKPVSEILHSVEDRTDVEYYVNGMNFKDFGVHISKSNGLIGQLERKEGYNEDWGSRHGTMRNHNYVRYKERTITLECFLEASSRAAFVEWQNRFFDQFRQKGTQRLVVEYAGSTKPLVYEVTMQNGADPEKEWGRYNDGLMVGTFTLTLVEDDPVKMMLRHITAEADSTTSFKLTTYSPLTVFWGDGNVTNRVRGEQLTVEHTYKKPGEYDIIIAGLVEEISDFETNDIIVWQRLM